MPISRPLTKQLLKKLYLKTLSEIRPGGKLDGRGHQFEAVIGAIHVVFPEIGVKVRDDEMRAAWRAVFELERDGFIEQDERQGIDFKVLTVLGRTVVEDQLGNMKLPSIDIGQLLSREDLITLVRDDFNSAEYETAVFKAFKRLEEVVRSKAKESAAAIGVTLMSSAFGSGGKLKHPGAAVPQEQEGLHHMMRGAIAWFKNPSSHRTVARDDIQQAAHILALANLLLDLADACPEST